MVYIQPHSVNRDPLAQWGNRQNSQNSGGQPDFGNLKNPASGFKVQGDVCDIDLSRFVGGYGAGDVD
jgi:hypothetical protein